MTENPDGLGQEERDVYAAVQARGLAGLSWSPDSCELVGDVTVACYVRLQAPDSSVMNLYTVSVTPENVVDTLDGVMPHPSDPNYQVVGFD